MQEITLDEIDELSTRIETVVDATPLIDHWCSGPDWQIPVATAFAPDAERLLLTTEDGDGFAFLAEYRDERGPIVIGGIEPLWGFGSPIIGRDPQAVATEVARVLSGREDWRTLFLAGMPQVGERPPADRPRHERPPAERPQDDDRSERPHHDQHHSEPTVTLGIAFALSSLGQVGFAEGITRQIADLDDGYDHWLARRSPRFRRNLRQIEARAEATALIVEDVSGDPALIERLRAIEHRSWKGQQGSGITTAEMTAMYRSMIGRLQRRGRLQAHVATVDGVDVGYIVGGVRARRYRGLQLSYTDDARHLSVGNLLQNHQLRLLDRLDMADVYDLGMDFGYKRRWADRTETSLTVVVNRR